MVGGWGDSGEDRQSHLPALTWWKRRFSTTWPVAGDSTVAEACPMHAARAKWTEFDVAQVGPSITSFGEGCAESAGIPSESGGHQANIFIAPPDFGQDRQIETMATDIVCWCVVWCASACGSVAIWANMSKHARALYSPCFSRHVVGVGCGCILAGARHDRRGDRSASCWPQRCIAQDAATAVFEVMVPMLGGGALEAMALTLGRSHHGCSPRHAVQRRQGARQH